MDRKTIYILGAGGLILFIALGIRQSFGLFLDPISTDLGWGRGTFAFAIALQNLVWGLSQPFTGMIADRYGSARVLAAGGLFYAVGVAVMAVSTDPVHLYLGGGVAVGVGLSAAGFVVVLGAVGRAVREEKRSMALGIASMGGSMGQFCLVPLSGLAIGDFGWSTTLLIFAAGPLLMVPLAAAFARQASDVGAAPAASEPEQTMSEALAAARRHSGFWYLTAGFFVCGFHVTFIMTHLPAFAADKDMPGWVGAASLSLIGFFNIIGTYACGVLGGHYRQKYVLSGLYLLRALFIAVFLLAPVSTYSVLVFAGAMGLLWLGTVPLTSGLVAQIFGVRYMSTLFGIVFFSHQVGAFLGAWLGGLAYDLTGSYDRIWLIAIILGLVAAALHWPIADRPVRRLAEAATRG